MAATTLGSLSEILPTLSPGIPTHTHTHSLTYSQPWNPSPLPRTNTHTYTLSLSSDQPTASNPAFRSPIPHPQRDNPPSLPPSVTPPQEQRDTPPGVAASSQIILIASSSLLHHQVLLKTKHPIHLPSSLVRRLALQTLQGEKSGLQLVSALLRTCATSS